MIIRRVGTVSCAKITGTLYAIIGLIVGGLFSLVAVAGGLASSRTNSVLPMAGLFGMSAIVIFPILYGAAGFIGTLFAAWLYNILAGIVGGVRIDLEPDHTEPLRSSLPDIRN